MNSAGYIMVKVALCAETGHPSSQRSTKHWRPQMSKQNKIFVYPYSYTNAKGKWIYRSISPVAKLASKQNWNMLQIQGILTNLESLTVDETFTYLERADLRVIRDQLKAVLKFYKSHLTEDREQFKEKLEAPRV
jgi:hypothetical protein